MWGMRRPARPRRRLTFLGTSELFAFLPWPFSTLVPFALVLGILVFIHELGHYLAARWVGVHVEAFSIGFGKPLLRWRDKRGTEWRLSWIPLGGYVMLHGRERPEDASDSVRAAWIKGRTFNDKGVAARALVIAAGPIANFLLAIVLFGGLFAAVGRPVQLPVVSEVAQGSAAAAAGLQSGDRIDSIDGVATPTFADLRRLVASHPDQPLAMAVHRGDADLTVTATPHPSGTGAGRIGTLGIASKATRYDRLSVPGAVVAGVTETWAICGAILHGLWQVITGQMSASGMSGPLGIASETGQVAALGVASLVSFIALLSVNLGLLNLFPIPVLDGGHLMFYAAEAIRGRPLPPRVVDYGFRAGFAAILALFVFITANDLARQGVFHWVATRLGG